MLYLYLYGGSMPFCRLWKSRITERHRKLPWRSRGKTADFTARSCRLPLLKQSIFQT